MIAVFPVFSVATLGVDHRRPTITGDPSRAFDVFAKQRVDSVVVHPVRDRSLASGEGNTSNVLTDFVVVQIVLGVRTSTAAFLGVHTIL
nr:hypothetical protein [Halovenus carboxidivorans]